MRKRGNRGAAIGRTTALMVASVVWPAFATPASADRFEDSQTSSQKSSQGDSQERRILAAASTEAAAWVARADGLVSAASATLTVGRKRPEQLADQLKEAWDLYGRAWKAVPRSALPPRGVCRLALLMGDLGRRTMEQQSAAQVACQNALILGRTPEDMRNRAAALVMGPAAPTMDDLVSAFSLAEGSRRIGPTEPWGHVAHIDLALRLRDRALLDASLADLRRVAPTHEQTARVTASVSRVTGGWTTAARLAAAFLLLFAVGATALHALVRRWRHTRETTAALTCLLVILLSQSGAWGNPPAPTESAAAGIQVPSPQQQLDDPLGFSQLLMTLTEQAESATARGDHAAAAGHYEAIVAAVPQSAFGYARLCASLEAAGRLDRAVLACRAALTRPGAKAGDYTTFVRLLLSKSGTLTKDERRQVDAAIQKLSEEPRAALIVQRLRCNVAVHEHDVAALAACTDALVAAEPADPRTISFQWALALERGEALSAERQLRRARAAGVDGDSLQRMEGATRGLIRQRLWRGARWALLGAAASLALLLGRLAVRRARTLARARKPVGADDTTLQRRPAAS